MVLRSSQGNSSPLYILYEVIEVLPDDYCKTHPRAKRTRRAQEAGWTRIQFCGGVRGLDEFLAWHIYHTHLYIANGMVVGYPPGKNHYSRLPYLYEGPGKEPPPYVDLLAEFGSWEHVKSVVEGILKWNEAPN